MKQIFSVLIGSMLVSAVLFLNACNPAPEQEPKKKDRPHIVEIEKVTLSKQGVQRVRTGTLRALREIKIFNQEEGRITALPFFEGDHIKEGDIVAKLDDKVLRAQLDRARATRKQAEQDLKRINDLFKQKLVSDEQLNRAETNVEVVKADEEVLATRIGYTIIRSPINGVVSERLTQPGNIAERYTHLLTISDPTSLITEVTISELIISQLKVNDPVQVTVDAIGPKSNPGKILRIHPTLDPVTRRGTVEVELKPVPQGARPGQLCRVHIQTQASERLMIPFSALRRDQDGEYVYVVTDEDKVKRLEVRSGLRIGEQLEILQGLSDGQRVITKGFLGLSVDKKVKIVQPGENVVSEGGKPKKDKRPAGEGRATGD